MIDIANAFSKKIENNANSVALFAMYYNFVRNHKTSQQWPLREQATLGNG